MSGLALAGTLCKADDAETDWIDAHVHVWPEKTDRYPMSENFSGREKKPVSFTPEELFAQQKGTGVTRTVLIQMSFYEFDNRYMTDVMTAHPGRFGGVGIVDHTKEGVAGEMKRLKEKGVRGFRLYAFPDRVKDWQKSEGIQKMWKTGADENLSMCCLTDPDALPVVHEMCEAYPDTRVVIDHFARLGMRGEIEGEKVNRLLALADFPNTYVKTSAFYALGKKQPPYEDLIPLIQKVKGAFGAERLMWGSDCPYQVQPPHTYEASVDLMKKLDFLSEEELEYMMRKTAEKLFFT